MEPIETKFLDSPESSVHTGSASPDTYFRKRSSNKGARVSHTKSRKGCVTCKRRKVKCDEQRPACFHCSRLREKCEYLSAPARKSPPRAVESPRPTISSTGGINLVDLELFHIYSTSTYSTLSMCSTPRDFWRITVPRLAIQNRYLMGEILALAALHLVYHRPEQRHQYLLTALTHHQAASQEAMELLKNVTMENAAGLFVFSSLTIVIGMATPKRSPSNEISPDEGDFEDWVYLIQGTAEIGATLDQACTESCLTPLFTFYRVGSFVYDTEKLDILTERISSLQSPACHVPDWEATDLFFWLYGCIDGFLPLVKARNQEAWVVMAHFCLILKKAETQWWLQGWADCTMRKIHQELDDEHKSWILGPAEEMGWIPLGV
ncbi:hypothetical protein EDB80DRAFT_882537 [Ilyonectria destructans]|nr:hypothetical protein EDB80DRAFT_882537 [Ilyonectria destructans]